jgi:heat shock protein HslJ
MNAYKDLAALACCVAAIVLGSPSKAENGFPFDSELILDVDPMRGSKRIPNMDVAADGAIALEMWCNRVEGQVIVAADTITVLTGQATDRQCAPERVRGDEELLAALTQVTNWRREGSIVSLIGPRTLRFRIPTN